MPFVLLIRHGENDFVKKGRLAGRMPGVHLNDRGIAQANALAEKLKAAPIKAIYSSPMERAMETAAPIAEALGLQVIPRDGLLETNFGDWQNKTLKSLRRRKLWKIVQGAPSRMRFPGGESFAECQLRIVNELESLCALHKPKDMLACVFHSDPIKLAIAYYLGMSLDNFQRLFISPASITALHMSEAGAGLVTMNYDLSLNFSKS